LQLYFPSHSPPLFYFNNPSTTAIYTLSLHDALPILGYPGCIRRQWPRWCPRPIPDRTTPTPPGLPRPLFERCRLWEWRHAQDERSEEHTSELQSRFDLVCRLLLEKKKKIKKHTYIII